MQRARPEALTAQPTANMVDHKPARSDRAVRGHKGYHGRQTRGREGERLFSHRRDMSTKRQRRITKQVRMLMELHREMKLRADRKGITLSRLLDEAVRAYFDLKGNVDH